MGVESVGPWEGVMEADGRSDPGNRVGHALQPLLRIYNRGGVKPHCHKKRRKGDKHRGDGFILSRLTVLHFKSIL